MSHEFYISIEGATQGKFKGESINQKEGKDKITGLSFEGGVKSPRDIATGSATGRRQHQPLKIVKEWGASSPQIFQAAATNELLKKVKIEFYKDKSNKSTGSAGTSGLELYYTIELTNATISEVAWSTGGRGSESTAKHTAQYDSYELETVSFTYQRIEVSEVLAKTSASADWTQ